MVAWNRLHREYAWDMLEFGLRLGYGRLLWDTTPKGKHPMIRALLRKSDRYPDLHPVVRGSMFENEMNLTPGRVDELRKKYAGTQREAEELEGLETWDDDDVLWHLEWIKDNRRPIPDRFQRRIVSIDPATTAHRGSDATGFSELGLGLDGQAYVIADHTSKMPVMVWGALAVERHIDGNCDCTVVERNKIGDAATANIRWAAKELDVEVRVLRPNERALPYRQCGSICIREVTAKQSKSERAGPVAGLYKAGRVSHVDGADLAELDDLLTEWEPAPGVPSPNALDAVVHGICELVDIDADRPDGRQMEGIVSAQKQLKQQTRSRMTPLIPRDERGGRI
jgi:phage terminase large subunit-like protein